MISGSPSGMSNGARLVSAIAAVKNSTRPTGCYSHRQLSGFAADIVSDAPFATIAPVSSVPQIKNAPTSDRPIDTSFDIICDELRRPPSSAHLLYDAQPAIVPPLFACVCFALLLFWLLLL